MAKCPGNDREIFHMWQGSSQLIGCQDVAFLPSKASFSTTFLKNCGRDESLGATTCHETVVVVSKGMLPVKYCNSSRASFVSVEIHGDHESVTKLT